mgnify:CR=1 FL=1
MGKFKKVMEMTSNVGYTADEGEPDTGFIRGNRKRKLAMSNYTFQKLIIFTQRVRMNNILLERRHI